MDRCMPLPTTAMYYQPAILNKAGQQQLSVGSSGFGNHHQDDAVAFKLCLHRRNTNGATGASWEATSRAVDQQTQRQQQQLQWMSQHHESRAYGLAQNLLQLQPHQAGGMVATAVPSSTGTTVSLPMQHHNIMGAATTDVAPPINHPIGATSAAVNNNMRLSRQMLPFSNPESVVVGHPSQLAMMVETSTPSPISVVTTNQQPTLFQSNGKGEMTASSWLSTNSNPDDKNVSDQPQSTSRKVKAKGSRTGKNSPNKPSLLIKPEKNKSLSSGNTDTSCFPSRSDRCPGRRGPSANFPSVLHKMVDAAEKEGYSDVVAWQPHGRAFRVRDQDRFTKEVMPKFTKQTRFSSFLRQLNLYGFLRLTQKGPDQNCYYHECFLRSKPDLCVEIQRNRIKKEGQHGPTTTATIAPPTEPNFYAMETMGPSSSYDDDSAKGEAGVREPDCCNAITPPLVPEHKTSSNASLASSTSTATTTARTKTSTKTILSASKLEPVTRTEAATAIPTSPNTRYPQALLPTAPNVPIDRTILGNSTTVRRSVVDVATRKRSILKVVGSSATTTTSTQQLMPKHGSRARSTIETKPVPLFVSSLPTNASNAIKPSQQQTTTRADQAASDEGFLSDAELSDYAAEERDASDDDEMAAACDDWDLW